MRHISVNRPILIIFSITTKLICT